MAPAIGFVGLGNMGAPMVRRLTQNGHALVLYDIRRAAVDALVGEGRAMRAARGLAELGEETDIVITMLPDSDVVRAAVLGGAGDDGFAHFMRRGGVVVDMSSCAPNATRRLGEALAELGIDLIDAPVSGGVPRARDGSLTIMAGGAPEIVGSVEPILACLGDVHRTGPLGSGHAAKALNNYVSAAGLLAVSEALIIAERFGLDPRVMNAVLKVSTGRNNTTDKKAEQYLLSRSFDSGFALDLLRKDVGCAQELATELDLDPPWLKACDDILDQAVRALASGADHTEAFSFLEQKLTGHD